MLAHSMAPELYFYRYAASYAVMHVLLTRTGYSAINEQVNTSYNANFRICLLSVSDFND